VVAEGYRFNVPIRWLNAAVGAQSFAYIDDVNLVLDTIKPSEDQDGIIVRLYECHGARGEANLTWRLPLKSAVRCGLLEDEQEPLDVTDGVIRLAYEPFKILTLKLKVE